MLFVNRKQKIQLIKDISTGNKPLKSLKALQHGSVYFAYHYTDIDRYGIFGHNKADDKLLTPGEYQDFCRQLEEHNKLLTEGRHIKNAVILCKVNSEDMRSLNRLINE